MAFTAVPSIRVARPKSRGERKQAAVCTATSQQSVSQATKIPGISGQLVNAVISIPPIWALMRAVSRKVVARYARRAGIEWAEHVGFLERKFDIGQRESILASVTDPTLEYPSYYIAPFHAYSVGNLGWEPAFEALPATVAIAYRTFTESGTSVEGLSPMEIVVRDRVEAFSATREMVPRFWDMLQGETTVSIADPGCGAGFSSIAVHRAVRECVGQDVAINVVGIDASPYMIAVAKGTIENEEIMFRHELIERNKFADDSLHMFCLQHVAHEIPDMLPILKEAFRVLRKGGMCMLVDNDAESRAMNALNPALLTLLKSTEPYCDVWWASDIEAVARSVGFVECKSIMVSERHRTYVFIK